MSSPCILAVSSLSNSTARHTWHNELDTLVTHVTTSSTGSTCNLICCVIRKNLWYVSYSLIYYSILFISCDGTNRISVCKSIKMTKLAQASTIACSSSAMFEQHGSTRSSRHVERVESRLDVTWRAKWNLEYRWVNQRLVCRGRTRTKVGRDWSSSDIVASGSGVSVQDFEARSVAQHQGQFVTTWWGTRYCWVDIIIDCK